MSNTKIDARLETTTHTLDAPGCVLTYDVRRNPSGAEPPLLIIGSPMGASGFQTLAGHFTDRTVVTYDPRGAERSKRTDGADRTTVEEHADDLHRLIGAVGGGPVDIFASSGGAVNALALVARHPADVRTLVAHEPPAFADLPDREQVIAACVDMHDTYLRSGFGPAMAKFIDLVSQQGPIPADYLQRPAPNPAMFGLPTEEDGSRDDPLVGLSMIPIVHFEIDFEAIGSASARVVIGVGEESSNAVAGRAGLAVAEGLGVEPVTFPGGHDGFAGGEYGRVAAPDAFAAKLREVLS